MADDPVEGMAAALNDAWLGRGARGLDWAWTCKHQPTIAGECRQRARAAWAYALAAMDELYPDREDRNIGPGVLDTLQWAAEAMDGEWIGPNLWPLIEMLRLACAEVEPSAGAATPSAAPPEGQDRDPAAEEGDGTGG